MDVLFSFIEETLCVLSMCVNLGERDITENIKKIKKNSVPSWTRGELRKGTPYNNNE